MNYLITGGCGFIGSNYINHLFNNKKIKKIINLDILYYCSSIYNINNTVINSEKYKFIHGDINNYNLIVKILKEYNITHIVHFAAQSHVDNSFNDSLQYTYDNVKGTHTILEAVKNTNRNIIILHFSTDEVYGESESDEMTENSILCPTNPYSASKAAAEMYVRSYIFSYKLKIIISRGNNVFGYNQYPEKLIPKFIKTLREGRKCTIHGNGESIRNFIFVDDVCTAIDFIISRGTFGHIYNIGSDHKYEKSVIEITKILINTIKNTSDYDKYIEYVDDRPFNDKRYLISNNKLKELGWEQNITFDEGMNKVLEHSIDTLIILFKPTEENLQWENFYNNLKDNINYKILIYSHNLKYSDINEHIKTIGQLINFIINSNKYTNYIIIDDYKNYNLVNCIKCIDNIDMIDVKNMFFKVFNKNIDDNIDEIKIPIINKHNLLKLLDIGNFTIFDDVKINNINLFYLIYYLGDKLC